MTCTKPVAPLIKSSMVSKRRGLVFPCLVGVSGHGAKVSLSLGSVDSQVQCKDAPRAPSVHLCKGPAQSPQDFRNELCQGTTDICALIYRMKLYKIP